MKRFLKGTVIGLGLLGIIFGIQTSYAQDLAEYGITLAFTPQKASTGLRVSSAKDDATGITKYTLSITNAPIPADAQNVELMIRYTASDGKEYVTKTGLVEYCQGEKTNFAVDLVCPFTGSGNVSKSDSSSVTSGSSVTGTTSTSITR